MTMAEWLDLITTVATIIAIIFAGVSLRHAERSRRSGLRLESYAQLLVAVHRCVDAVGRPIDDASKEKDGTLHARIDDLELAISRAELVGSQEIREVGVHLLNAALGLYLVPDDAILRSSFAQAAEQVPRALRADLGFPQLKLTKLEEHWAREEAREG